MSTDNLSRFELPIAAPESVRALPGHHPAITQQRTLFPTTVVAAKDSNRLLVSGHNNPKIGKRVQKGEWAGMPIYMLTLEERATCPTDCHVYRTCYGNAMPFARRHRHNDDFESYLAGELLDLADEHPDGFVVRLHVLGDFYSRAYVFLWKELLEKYPALHVYGYTSRLATSEDPESREIAGAIIGINTKFKDRSFIRFSSATPLPFGATVIDRVPEAAVVPEGTVCPADLEATACCSTCGLCWSPAMRKKTIVFVAHGMGSTEQKAEIRVTSKKDDDGLRPIRPLNTGLTEWGPLKGRIIEIRQAAPSDLYVDERYQRSLTGKGAKLIRKISETWDWRKFNLPTVTEDVDGRLHVIDGQHTAIAAASRNDIPTLPVKLVDAESIFDRAQTFVGINRDRVAVTAAQIFYAELAAGDPTAVGVKAMCDEAEIIILRQQPANGSYGPGETMAISTLQRLYRVHGGSIGGRVMAIAAATGVAPISEYYIRAITDLITKNDFKPRLTDEQISQTARRMGRSLLAKAYAMRAETGSAVGPALARILYAEGYK